MVGAGSVKGRMRGALRQGLEMTQHGATAPCTAIPAMPDIVLHHFLFSHYNEKARWALAYKAAAHRRVTQTPGLHAAQMNKLTGKTSTPALLIDGEPVSGSAALIDRLERVFPEPPLYPADAALREQALAWQVRLDDQLGPASRSVVWGVLIDTPRYTASLFGQHLNPVVQLGYSLVLRLARQQIVQVNSVRPADIASARALLAPAMDEIAAAVETSGYLVGEAFSVADLTAACLLSPMMDLRSPDMHRPEPHPPALQALVDEYAGHPAIAWAYRMFEQHRPANPH